jgi:hypothetical protein
VKPSMLNLQRSGNIRHSETDLCRMRPEMEHGDDYV